MAFEISPLVSIILPCYNAANTIRRAINSIIFQKVDFLYEVLCVDDASSDQTISILREYEDKYPHIKIIRHENNLGNAHAFYSGLKECRGKYFHVLDCDDFFTINNKLQKQVEFFENDKHEEYCAACHYYIIVNNNGSVYVPNHNLKKTEFTWKDFLDQNHQYLHTSTYMFRNIYHGNPPDFFKQDAMRGDHPRILTQLLLTHKKVKVLGFYGSAYSFSYNGIWSKLTIKEQLDRNLAFCDALKKITSSLYVRSSFEKWKENFREKFATQDPEALREFSFVSKDEQLMQIKTDARGLAFGFSKFCFHSLYKTTLYDTLCATIGCVYLVENDLFLLGPEKSAHTNRILIVVPDLMPRGGGIFSEIKELTEIFRDKEVTILVTERSDIDPEAVLAFEDWPHVKMVSVPENCPSVLRYLFNVLLTLVPERTYYYVGHDNPYIDALVQPGPSKNIHVFSYDHGFVMGVANPNFDSFLVKRPVDHTMLSTMGYKNLVYIPVWQGNPDTRRRYEPFREHTKLITASAAVRWYKCENVDGYDYLDSVFALLLRVGGKHIHYGPIPEERVQQIFRFLEKNGLAEDCFINIPWAENLANSLLEHNVDVFIEPFAVVSAKITLVALSIGLPVFSFNGRTRLTTCDFIYPHAMRWDNSEDFLTKLESVNRETLVTHSKLSLDYFNVNHSLSILGPYVRENTSFCTSPPHPVSDNFIAEMTYANTNNRALEIQKEEKARQEKIAEQARMEKARVANKLDRRKRVIAVILTTGLFSVALVLAFWCQLNFLPKKYPLLLAISNAFISILIAVTILFTIRSVRLLGKLERIQMIIVWLLSSYAFALTYAIFQM